ncbi:MAG: hypothetical protein ACK5WZ_01525 [Pseudobdellovibrionaceae bacterium]
MKRIFLFGLMTALTTSCSTLDQSFRLGATTGALTGAAATYAAQSANGRSPSLEEVSLGASIGLGIGLIASYFIHQEVVEDREGSSRQTEIYFGDLPPSPFVIPQPKMKKGNR